MKLPSNNLDQLNLAGLQEIEDHDAESCSGGAFTVRRFNSNGTLFTTAQTEHAGNSFFAGGGIYARDGHFNPTDRIQVVNDNSTAQIFAVYAERRDEETLMPVRDAFVLQPGAVMEVDIPGDVTRNDDHFIVAHGNDTNQAVARIFNTANDLREVRAICSRGCAASDRRLKTDVVSVGFHEELGVELYSWQYINDDPTRYVGVMAQDLLARPELAHAVVVAQEGEFAGFYAVNYAALGLQMVTEAEWHAQGSSAVVNQSLAVCA